VVMRGRRALGATAASLVLVVSLVGCGSATTSPGASGSVGSAAPLATSAPASPAPAATPVAYADTLRVGWNTDDPWNGFRNPFAGCVPCGLPWLTVGSVVYSGLYRFDERFTAVPDLADGPCVPQADPKVIRCRLIETTFHDGTPLTADDVAYTFQLGMAQGWFGTLLNTWSVKEVRAIDPRIVEFVLTKMDPTFLTTELAEIPIFERRATEASYADFVARTATLKASDLIALADAIDKETSSDPPVCSQQRQDAAAAVYERLGLPLYRDDFSRGGAFDPCAYLQGASWGIRTAGEALGATGLDAVADAFWVLPANSHPIGTGPYRFVSESADLIRVQAWPGYHGGLAATKYIDFVPAAGDGSDVAAGTVDIAQLPPLSSLAALGESFKAAERSGTVRLASSLRNGYEYLGFNLRPGRPFADLALREALQRCIDLPRDVDAATRGTGTPVYGPVTPGTWAFDPSLARPARDVVAARALIESAGWNVGADGVYEKDGARLAAQIVVRERFPDRIRMADLIGEQARDCGMDISTLVLPTDGAFATISWPLLIPGTKSPFDLTIWAWGLDADPGNLDMFTTATIVDKEHPDANNYTGFSDPLIDRLATEAMATYDQAKRTDLYRQAQQELARQLPYLFLWNLTNKDAMRTAVETTSGPFDPSVPYWAWAPERLVVTANE
jgi:ABC-type transport system substrate-binding protein